MENTKWPTIIISLVIRFQWDHFQLLFSFLFFSLIPLIVTVYPFVTRNYL